MSKLNAMVATAADIGIADKIVLVGDNTYYISSGNISWSQGTSYSYRIKEISNKFGQIVEQCAFNLMRVSCGDDAISAFDFGLLYLTFCAMVWEGTTYPGLVEIESINTPRYNVVWLNGHAILYDNHAQSIIDISSPQIVDVLKGSKISLLGFTDKIKYQLSYHTDKFILDCDDGSFIQSIDTPRFIRETYGEYLTYRYSHSMLNDNSPLADTIASNNVTHSYEDIFARAKYKVDLDVTWEEHSELMFTPTQGYKSLSSFLGSRAYTDNGELIIPVNWRNSLLLYTPWFSEYDVRDTDSLLYNESPNLNQYRDVSIECTKIAAFAGNLKVNLPENAICLDVSQLAKIQEKYLNEELPIVSFKYAIGRIVVPLTAMHESFKTNNPYEIFIILPVGSITDKIIHKAVTGKVLVCNMPCTIDDVYVDVTEVIN